MRLRTALAAGLLGIFVVACSSDESPGAGGDEVTLYPTTKILDEGSLRLVTDASPDLATMTFGASSPALDGLSVGDVVMGGVSAKTPHGVLRRITTIDRTGGAVKLGTKRAGLADAIAKGRIRLPLTRLTKDGSMLRPKTSAATNFDQDFTLGVNDIELAPGVKAGASVGFGLGIDLDLEVSASEVSGKVVLSGSQSATVDIHALVAAKFSNRYSLGGVDFPPIVFQAGPVPIVITSGLSAAVGMEGSTSAAFDWSATEKSFLDSGLKVGTTGVEPILDGDAEATADPPKLNGNMNARGYVELKLDVAVNALLVEAAFYVGAQGYVKIDVDTARTADCFKMSTGLDGIYGINTSLLGDLITVYKTDDTKNLFDKPFSSGSCASDPLAITPWAKVVAATSLDRSPKLALLSDQSLVITSSTAGSTGFVTRLTPDGQPLWENAIGGVVGASTSASPAIDEDGSSWIFGTAQTNPIAMRLGSDGTRTRATVLTSATKPYPNGALFVASKDGGVLMGGTSLDASDKYVEWAAKLDAAGKVVWAKSYGGVSEVRGVAEANDGGVLLVGDSVVAPGAAMRVTRISPAGDLVFSKTYGEGRLYGVIPVASGGLAATGATAQGNGGVVLRIADDGSLMWGFSYEDTSADKAEYQGRAILERTDGFLVAGRRGFGSSADFWALQVAPDGGLGWSRTYGGAKEDEVKSIARTSDNGAILVGETYSFVSAAATSATMVMRIPPSGAFEFTAGSGGSSRNVEGAKQPLPGAQTTISATASPMGAVAAPAGEDAWPLAPAPAKHTKL